MNLNGKWSINVRKKGTGFYQLLFFLLFQKISQILKLFC